MLVISQYLERNTISSVALYKSMNGELMNAATPRNHRHEYVHGRPKIAVCELTENPKCLFDDSLQ
jgi:hypothetical protein